MINSDNPVPGSGDKKQPADERAVAGNINDSSAGSGRNLRLEGIIQRMVNSDDSAEIRDTYADWAKDYDADLLNYGYQAPEIGARSLAEHLGGTLSSRENVRILDAGCGTGLVGKELALLGFQDLHGSDFSREMIEIARSTQNYNHLLIDDFTKHFSNPDASFDAAISIGVYKPIFSGILIPELVRVCKAGAPIVFSARPQYFNEACRELDVLVAEELILPYQHELLDYITGQSSQAHFFLAVRN